MPPKLDVNRERRITEILQSARYPLALTGAGISVASGIPDFRSTNGLWKTFKPEEYATLQVFRKKPEKAWILFRALGKLLKQKHGNKAHQILAQLEQCGWLKGIVTQNIDGLHQGCGTRNLVELHGNYKQLHCLECQAVRPLQADDLSVIPFPSCPVCHYPLKPRIVLFGEQVHGLDTLQNVVNQVDLLLVIGTSCSVYPAADIPRQVTRNGGVLVEFNLDSCLSGYRAARGGEIFFPGKVTQTLPVFKNYVDNVLNTR